MTFKKKLQLHYLELLNEKILNLKNQISDLAEDAQNDAKGSAGDKHEVGLSMMQLEQEKLSQQLKEVIIQKQFLEAIDCTIEHKFVTKGSLVSTDRLTFFITLALPKITIEKKEIIALSLQSPLGNAMKGKRQGDSFSFNEIHCKIQTLE